MKSSISRLCLALIFSACASAPRSENDGPAPSHVEPVGIALRVDNQSLDPVTIYLAGTQAFIGQVPSQNRGEITFQKTQIREGIMTLTLALRGGKALTLVPMVVGKYDWCYKITVGQYIQFSTIEAC